MTTQPFDDNPRLRASDADRDRAASTLNNAMAEGRLTADEHSARLDALYAAKTHADIVPLLDDLPGRTTAAPVSGPADERTTHIVAVLSGANRTGSWAVPSAMNVVALLGGVELDFREAALPAGDITISATCILGGLNITVPPEMQVIDTGVAILGGREIDGGDGGGEPGGPVLRLTGFCFLGGVEVKRKGRAGQGRIGGRRGIAD
jgi:hypothetical protein